MGRDEGNPSRAREGRAGEVNKARIKSLREGRERRRRLKPIQRSGHESMGAGRSPLARDSQEREV